MNKVTQRSQVTSAETPRAPAAEPGVGGNIPDILGSRHPLPLGGTFFRHAKLLKCKMNITQVSSDFMINNILQSNY